MTIEPQKLAVLVYATDEQLSDTGPILEQLITRTAGEEIAFLTGDGIVDGTGAGQPLGILQSGCLVPVEKETGQAATTVVKANIDKMWSRCHARSRERSVWLVNQDVEPQLEALSADVGTGGVPVYLPAGGIADAPNARLKGRPVVVSEFCPTLGTVGDIILADLSQYLTVTRGDVQAASSIHVQFTTDETAFRFTYRVDGQPWWSSAVTPFNGTNTQSPFVALATRS
jgi:HK97 family phage major capsid protein